MSSNGTARLSREPQPLPEAGAEEAPLGPPPPARSLLTEGARPRPVTAATARRCRLWDKSTLIYEDPFGAYRIDFLAEDLTAVTAPDDPELDPKVVELCPTETLTFNPG